MSLTPKQEAFCLVYLETGNASEAYRQAYESDAAQATVNRSAKTLMDNPKIAARLQELRQPAVQAAQMTLESHLQDLKRMRDAALMAEKFGPAIQAEIARGKVSGFYVDRVEMEATVVGLAERMRQQRGKD